MDTSPASEWDFYIELEWIDQGRLLALERFIDRLAQVKGCRRAPLRVEEFRPLLDSGAEEWFAIGGPDGRVSLEETLAAIGEADYELRGVNWPAKFMFRARVEFEPFDEPCGGIEGLMALIRAFGHVVLVVHC